LRHETVADLPAGYVGPDGFDYAGEVVAGDVGQVVGGDDDAEVADFLVVGVYCSGVG
jgi:hypothetical protein